MPFSSNYNKNGYSSTFRGENYTANVNVITFPIAYTGSNTKLKASNYLKIRYRYAETRRKDEKNLAYTTFRVYIYTVTVDPKLTCFVLRVLFVNRFYIHILIAKIRRYSVRLFITSWYRGGEKRRAVANA